MKHDLPRSVLDSRDFHPEERFAALRDAMNVLGEIRNRDDPEAVDFRIEAFQLPGMVVSRQQAPTLEMGRSRARIARDTIDHYVLQILFEGVCHNRDGANGGFDSAQPGDILVIDCTEPQATAIGPHKGYSLVVSRQALAPLLKRADGHHLSVLRGDRPPAALLRQNIVTLHREAGRMTEDDAQAVAPSILALTASVIDAELPDAHRKAVNQNLLASIRLHVTDHIAEPSLTPASVAAGFGISLRKLSYLFEPLGGFAAYVQEARLRRCRAVLVDQAQSGKSIADIALACGFTNATSFSRAFHRAMGMTAREVRAHAAAGLAGLMALSTTDEWWQWIGRL